MKVDSGSISIVAAYPSRARAIRRAQVARLRRIYSRIGRGARRAQHVTLLAERVSALLRERKTPLHLVDVYLASDVNEPAYHTCCPEAGTRIAVAADWLRCKRCQHKTRQHVWQVAFRCRMSYGAIQDHREANGRRSVRVVRRHKRSRVGNSAGTAREGQAISLDQIGHDADRWLSLHATAALAQAESRFGLWTNVRRIARLDADRVSVSLADAVLWFGTCRVIRHRGGLARLELLCFDDTSPSCHHGGKLSLDWPQTPPEGWIRGPSDCRTTFDRQR